MLTSHRTMLMCSLLLSQAAAALPDTPPPPPTPPPAVEASGPSVSGRGARPFRVRIGALGGVLMQKSQFALGGAWDFLRPTANLRIVADFTLGVRPNELSLLPMVGARFVIPVGKAPVEVAVGLLGGVNVTMMRGGTGVALPVRVTMGGQYLFRDGMGVGLELGAEIGPLIAPFSAPYAALHVSALFAWGT